MDRSAEVRALAEVLGFDRVGFAKAEPTSETRRFREWVDLGYAGELSWLSGRADEREDPRRVLAGAKTVIVAALAQGAGSGDEGRGGVARYAQGDDYHDVLLDRLHALEAGLAALHGDSIRTRAYVDTGPVLERVWAARAGLGWQGKNTLLIDKELGSFLFLGVLLTDLELRPDPPGTDHCGSCRACLDACPTDAFRQPYVLDARRCLSYSTIELRDAIPEELREAQADWVFGCDICQTVCPWNRPDRRPVLQDPLGLRERLASREVWRQPTLSWLLELSEESWREHTKRSALRRTRYRGLMRNALIAAGNSGDPSLMESVRRHADGADELLAEHARWALGRLETGARG